MVCSAGETSSHHVVEYVIRLLHSHDLAPESSHRAQDNANDPLTTMDAVEVIEAFAAIPAALPLLLVRPKSSLLTLVTSLVLHPLDPQFERRCARGYPPGARPCIRPCSSPKHMHVGRVLVTVPVLAHAQNARPAHRALCRA